MVTLHIVTKLGLCAVSLP